MGNNVGPFLSGFVGDDYPLDLYHSGRVRPDKHLQYFLLTLDKLSQYDKPTMVIAHNLEWDLVQLLIGRLDDIKNDHLTIPIGCGALEVTLSQPCFGVFRQKKRQPVFIRDSFAFFKTSLRDVAKAIGVHEKDNAFPDIGSRVFSLEEMGEYFTHDLKAVRSVGTYIAKLHTDFKIPDCTVSIPHFSSCVFRESIDKPLARVPEPKFGLQTYYGGKTRSVPGVYHNIHCYDVNSEYPYAMTKLPKLCCGSYEPILSYKGPWGVYCVTKYDFKKCAYGTLYHHKIKVKGETLRFLDSCKNERFFACGWDLEAAMDCGSLTMKKGGVCGYYWKEKKCGHDHVFQKFVTRCYSMRGEAKKHGNDILSLTYKLILNSLYGKFSQFRYDPLTGVWKPGTLFDPMIAGMITGYGRYLIHQFEHQGDSVYTSTDSVFTSKTLPTGPELGQLKHEFTARHLIILRNKVYFAFDRNYVLIKWAGHGLQCDSPLELIQAFARGELFIKKTRLIKRKEGVKRKITPGSVRVRVQNLEGLVITDEMKTIFIKAAHANRHTAAIPQTL